jgi:hypothetical protein
MRDANLRCMRDLTSFRSATGGMLKEYRAIADAIKINRLDILRSEVAAGSSNS